MDRKAFVASKDANARESLRLGSSFPEHVQQATCRR